MPGKSASKSPSSKKRSLKNSPSSSAKKRRTQSHRPPPSVRLTPPSPNLNAPVPNVKAPNKPTTPKKPAPPKGKALKSHSWRNVLRGPSEGQLMKNRLAKMERRYQHYLKTGEVRPLSP